MARQVRSHGLDKRASALGYRLVRVDPEQYATWAIVPTRKRVHLGVRNLDSVQSVIERMEESLWLEFGNWFTVGFGHEPQRLVCELGQAEHFLSVIKGLTDEGTASLIRRWYEPTE